MRIDGIELELDEDESLTCNSARTQTDCFVIIQRQKGREVRGGSREAKGA